MHHQERHESKLNLDGAFIISIAANAIFVLVQFVFSYIAHSSSLFADAVHNLGDVMSLVLAFIAARLSNRSPTMYRTYGFKKSSIIAALMNGMFLVFSCGVIIAQAIHKWLYPSPVMTFSVMLVASIGIAVNGISALLFVSEKKDLNIRAAFLHLLSDALVSLAVVIGAALMRITGWFWLDPVLGVCIAGVILKSTWFLFADAFRLLIDGVPRHISLHDVKVLLQNEPGVSDVHDLHVWALSTSENALSVHLWMPDNPLSDEARQKLSCRLMQEYHIQHVTIQVERLPSACQGCQVKPI